VGVTLIIIIVIDSDIFQNDINRLICVMKVRINIMCQGVKQGFRPGNIGSMGLFINLLWPCSFLRDILH
jgi:hypothetical protein